MSLDDLEALMEPVDRPSHVQVLQQAVFLREAYADVRDRMTLLCRLWWLSAHTRGCTFETARQVMFRQQHDVHAMRVDPTAVALTDWPVMVREAMAVLGQATGVSKDGNPLGPVCPGLQTFVQKNKSAGGRQGQSGDGASSSSSNRGSYTQGGGNRCQGYDRGDGTSSDGYKRTRQGARQGRSGGAGGQTGKRKEATARTDAGSDAPEAADVDA